MLSLTIAGWLMVGLFEGPAPGFVPFKCRKTAFANFQTKRVLCDDRNSFEEKAEVTTGVMCSNVHCN